MSYHDFLKKNPEKGIEECPVCGKRFIPSVQWAYKLGRYYYCRYNCYKQGGGDNVKRCTAHYKKIKKK